MLFIKTLICFFSLLGIMSGSGVFGQCSTEMKTLAVSENENPDSSIRDLNQNFSRLADCVRRLQSENNRLNDEINALERRNRAMYSSLTDSLLKMNTLNIQLATHLEDLNRSKYGKMSIEEAQTTGSRHSGQANADGLVIAFAEATSFGVQGSLHGDTITESVRDRVSTSSISWTDQTRMRQASIVVPVRQGQEWEVSFKSDIGDETSVNLHTLWLSFTSH